VALALPFTLITVFLLSLVVRARKGKVVTGVEGMLGETGVTIGPLAPEGRVFVRGEYWNASSELPLPAGVQVRVTAVHGLKLVVEPASKSSGE
jgi:membrane-bound serine protease (ClpP class)